MVKYIGSCCYIEYSECQEDQYKLKVSPVRVTAGYGSEKQHHEIFNKWFNSNMGIQTESQ